jgi:Transposase DDE domain group 1
MPTECSQDSFDFGSVEGRDVVAAFDGGAITSDAGALLLGQTNKAISLTKQFAACFSDARTPEAIEHSVETMVGQIVFGHCLGYEDLVDHDLLRHDPVLAVLAGKLQAGRKDCTPLAGKSTLNRLQLSLKNQTTRYCKIGHDPAMIEQVFVKIFLQSQSRPKTPIILDLDATHSVLHGEQEGRFFQGYYDCYCYLPLFIFCGRHLLAAKLRTADRDAADGALDEVKRIVAQIRETWPGVKIWLRGDSGFCREELMAWCEANQVDYVFGLAKNPRLVRQIARDLVVAKRRSTKSGKPERAFKELKYATLDTWSKERRVVAKAEWTGGEANPRFVVTSLDIDRATTRFLYENVYCARGDMENRIKECQRDMFADRMPAATLRVNQLRLWFSAMAYVLMCALRRIALAGTQLANATCATIRLRLLKIGALVTTSVRRVKIAFASAFPLQATFALAHERLCNATR